MTRARGIEDLRGWQSGYAMDLTGILHRLAPDGRHHLRGNGFMVRCPAHHDPTPSLSVDLGDNGAVLLHCFAGCSVENICAAIGIEVADLSSDSPGRQRSPWRPLPPPVSADTIEKAAKRAAWPPFSVPTRAELWTLSHLRRLSPEWLQLAVDRGLLWSCDHQGTRCWVVTDSTRRVAQARRYDGAMLCTREGDTKAMTLPGSLVRWPVGWPGFAPFPCVMVVEGSADLLAAHGLIVAEGREVNCAAVAMLGASPAIHPDALPAFAGKAVVIYAHADEAGERAAANWCAALRPHAARVEVVSFSGLRQADLTPVEDLNDIINLHLEDYEANRWLWSLCPGAKEVVR